MTPDLEKSIIQKHPSLFANVGQKGSPMCFGLEVGDGWAGIISTMCFILQQKDTDKKVRFDQIKEKFGLLRVYHTGGNDYTAGVVRMAEDISGKTCEVCGQPGEQRKGGWIRTLCDWCHGGESKVSSQENSRPCPYVTGRTTPASAVSVDAWAVVCGDCVDSTFIDRDEAVQWASGIIPPAHIVPLYRRHDAMTLTGGERAAILLAIECLHDQPHTSMHQTVLRSARDLRGLLDRT